MSFTPKDPIDLICHGVENNNGDMILAGLEAFKKQPKTKVVIQCRSCSFMWTQEHFTPAESCRRCGSSDTGLPHEEKR